MEYLVVGVLMTGALGVLNLLLTAGVLRRLRQHERVASKIDSQRRRMRGGQRHPLSWRSNGSTAVPSDLPTLNTWWTLLSSMRTTSLGSKHFRFAWPVAEER
jgi:hypothetical protein